MKKGKLSQQEGVFLPVMDWWIAALISVLLVILVAAIPLLIWEPIHLAEKIIGVSGLFIVILYLVDVTFFTHYILGEDELFITSQLREMRIPYRTMKTIRPGGIGALFSMGKHKRFSLSARGLTIQLSQGHWKYISISPQHQQKFLDHLMTLIDNERSGRASRIKGKLG
jgi:hypothetical protein